MDPRQTRGFFNCNPGNMDRDLGGPPWKGEIRDPSDPAVISGAPASAHENAVGVRRFELLHGRFCVFVDAPHGIRAIVHNLRAYHERLGCRTIRDYINRWAPPNENNTAGYIARVAAQVAVDPDVPVDIRDHRIVRALVDGIINVECAGMPYEGEEIERGLALAEAA
jgi:hypothetical protein